MTTENIDQSASSSADPNVETSTGGKGSSQEVEIDWKARAETAEAAGLKLENDLKSEKGRRDLRMEQQADDIGGINARLDALANRTASGETESLPADFAKINQDTASKNSTRNWDVSYKEAEESLGDALLDDNDKTVVDQSIVDELSAAWKEATQNRNIPALYRVVGQANREAKAAIKLQAKETVAETENTAKEAKKVSDAKNGVHNLSVGTPSGIGGGKSMDQIAKATNVNDISDEDYAKWLAG